MKKILMSMVLFMVFIGQAYATPVYMRSNTGLPWGQTSNEASMDAVFGGGGWDDLRYETVNTASLFSASNRFIFMEGGDSTANELEAFITANQVAMESWVAGGGSLFINSAPNEGDGMSYGFGVSLNYPDFATDPNTGVDPAHAIFNGPYGATGNVFTGNWFGHATVTGAGLNDLILNANGDSVLSEMAYGAGFLMVGGMTTLNFQDPNSDILRQNVIHYAAANAVATPEPAIAMLLAMGLVGFGFARRK